MIVLSVFACAKISNNFDHCCFLIMLKWGVELLAFSLQNTHKELQYDLFRFMVELFIQFCAQAFVLRITKPYLRMNWMRNKDRVVVTANR